MPTARSNARPGAARLARAVVVAAAALPVMARATPPVTPSPSSKAAAPSPATPRLYVSTLPAAVAFIAWLPAAKKADEVDLDLKIHVVLPRDCGDEVGGLLARPESTSRAPAYDVLLRRNALGKCGDKAVRRMARVAIRVALPKGAQAPVAVGPMALSVARANDERGSVTIDGREPEGELPGAPPTGRPWALAAGEVTEARAQEGSARAAEQGTVIVETRIAARYPACAQAPDGVLGSGAGVLSRFVPIARLSLDEPCAPMRARTDTLPILVRPGKAESVRFSVGAAASAKTIEVPRPPRLAEPKPDAQRPDAARPEGPTPDSSKTTP